MNANDKIVDRGQDTASRIQEEKIPPPLGGRLGGGHVEALPVQRPHPNPPPNGEGILSETGGPKGPEPTRYGDWEIGGKCVDF